MSARLLALRANRLATGIARPVLWRRPGGPNFSTTYHNAVLVRNASFARMLPKLAAKFIRVPAMFGGIAIGGLAWVQYQTIQAGNYAANVLNTAKDTVTETTSTLFGGAKEVAKQTMLGFEKTRDGAKETWAEWMESMSQFDSANNGGAGGAGGGQNGGKEPPKQSRVGAGAAAAAGTAVAVASEGDGSGEEVISADPEMVALTREMIEIRSILQKVDQSSAMSLPSIVVIGSQSSGKSSVLEAIVGHDFLPKGSNMVTRRPIELTLVNTPDSMVDYGEFPDLGMTRITDFSVVRRKLTELNQVPDSLCVSDEPIQLRIYSRKVPDLSLIDLPGYIRVEDMDQPKELRHSIAMLCEKYIQAPNIILAVSSAEADLANSSALEASRRVDPRGERTIGVLTKMDLVDAAQGASVLKHNKYPLRLGYVGVVTKAPTQSHSLFKKGPNDVYSAMAKHEAAYFSAYPDQFGPSAGLKTGTATLRRELTRVLEASLSGSLHTTEQAVERELKETSYKLKSQFGDRTISAAAYLSACLDDYKHHLRSFRDRLGEQQLHDLVKAKLDHQAFNLLAERYWNARITDLSVHNSDPMRVPLSQDSKDYPGEEYLENQLAAAGSALASCGVGQLSAEAIEAVVRRCSNSLVDQSEFRHNDLARNLILEETSAILTDRHGPTVDGVEHAIKPFKVAFRFKPDEWENGRQHVAGELKKELKYIGDYRREMVAKIGDRRKAKDVVSFVDKARRGLIDVDSTSAKVSGAGGFTADLLETGRMLVYLRDRENILKMRLLAVKSRQCADMKNRAQCPEVYLDAAATKLTSTAVLFLDVELLWELHSRLPWALEGRLVYNLSAEDKEKFAKQDPKIRQHLEILRKKELLETALDKMKGLRIRQAVGREMKSWFGRGQAGNVA